MRVLVSDVLGDIGIKMFQEAEGIEVDVKTGLSPEALKEIIGDFHALVIRSATRVTADLLEAATNLQVIGRAGIGLDNVDIPAATKKGVAVMNTPEGNVVTTAEHAIAMMLALAREIPAADRSTRAGKWEKSRFMGVELYGKTLGLIGCGNIGSIVADRAIGLRMRVVAYDPFLSPGRARDLGVEKLELDELLARADVISLHTPLTDQTRGIIGAAALAKTRPGVRVVNCARGGLVVEADLLAALESGHVAGAALDVFEQEPATDNPLFALDQVVATPHLGASTREAQENVALQVAEQMADFLLLGAVTNALNMPSVSAEEAPKLMPYMKLAEQLGSFAGQVTETGLRKVTVEYEGHVATLNTKPLTAVVLQGLLTPLMDSVNMVNAPVVAERRNIEVSEVKHNRPGDYQTLIRVAVTTERRSRDIAGTLFGGTKPRVVQIKGIGVEAELGPHMLFITNEDRAGFIGALGSTLGEAGVNIATFHLGRAEQGADALALIEVDEPLSDDVLAAVKAISHVHQAIPLSF